MTSGSGQKGADRGCGIEAIFVRANIEEAKIEGEERKKREISNHDFVKVQYGEQALVISCLTGRKMHEIIHKRNETLFYKGRM